MSKRERKINVELGKQGFQETEKSRPTDCVLETMEDQSDDPIVHTLPNGVGICLHAMPDRDVFTPVSKPDGNGNFNTFFVGVTDIGPSSQPMVDCGYVLGELDFNYANEEMSARDLVREHCATTGDLDRAILLTKISENPVQYEGRPVGNEFYADGGDDDEWKNADAAFILPEDRVDEGYETWVDEINIAAHGKTYAIVVEKHSPTGQFLDEHYDDYEGTLVEDGDAVMRMESHLDDPEGYLDDFDD